MSKQKQDLGKGIRALLQNMESDENEDLIRKKKEQAAHSSYVPLSSIEINPFQPRVEFDEAALKDLADSIKIHGVVQPVTLRRLPSGKYQLISGERRLRASRLAGLSEIPAFVRDANDQEMLEIALIENIQRENLNAMEVAINFKRLLDECSLTHEQLAERLGKNRTTVTNFLRLLKLPPDIQKGLKAKLITMGHARAISGLEDPVAQLDVYKQTIDKGLSVREVEQLIKHYQSGREKTTSKKGQQEVPGHVRKVQDSMASHLGTRVQIKRDKSGKGQIVISFFSDDDLHRIKELID
jgi:ParB family chromosome partitioning protein